MKQITIVTEERKGLVAEISSLLAARQINIETIDAESAHGHVVVIMTVDLYDVALVALRDAGFHAVSEDAILIRIPDEPGALAKIAERFRGADIPMRSLRIIRRRDGWGLVAISTERTEEALELVRDVLVS